MRTSSRWVVAGMVACAATCAPAPAQAVPYSSHSQIYSCCTDPTVQDTMFREAKESGAAYIRVDIDMPTIFRAPASAGMRDWTGVDRIAQLSRQYGVGVLAVLLGSPDPASGCASAAQDSQRVCPPADPATWASQAAEVAARYAGTINHWEIWNEPDGRWAFAGQPEDYGRMLAPAYDRIKLAAPASRVVLGGTQESDARGAAWLDRVFRTPGTDAAHKWDISSIHLRKDARAMIAEMWARGRFLQSWGRTAPTWVTEHGYPSDPRWQGDPGFVGGENAQAAYLSRSLPALAQAGADQVFVTLRDGGGGLFESEGILQGQGRPGEPFRRKPAWWAVRNAALRWPSLAFRSSYVDSRARVRRMRRHRRALTPAVRVTVNGRFRGPDCLGSLRLTYRVPRKRAVRRTVVVNRACRYRQVVRLRVPRKVRRVAVMRVSQRFLGNGQTGAGDSRTLKVKLPRRAP